LSHAYKISEFSLALSGRALGDIAGMLTAARRI